MIDNDKIDSIADVFENRFSKINRRILIEIGTILNEIGELTPSQAKKLQQMYTYSYNLNKITKQLSEVSGKSIEDIKKIYENVAKEEYDWSKPFYDAKEINQIPFNENILLQNIIKSGMALTNNTFKNISRTTAIGIKTYNGFKDICSFYNDTIDKAITAVATGVDDYNKVIRQSVKDLGGSGLRLKYESGYTRRIDSAVRQNIIDGVGYITQNIAKQNGIDFGANGVEISAHSPSAPDHLPYQGKQYTNEEFDYIQSTLKRPIGEWNCRHFAYPIIMGVSIPANSESELKSMERYSNEIIYIDGSKYTRYECTQIQRKLEKKIRYAREERELYKTVKDNELQKRVTEKIRILTNKYIDVSKKAGLPMRVDRSKIIVSNIKKINNIPKVKTIVNENIRIFSKNEIEEIAKETNKIIDKYVEKESRWSGKIIVDNNDKLQYGKLWNCDIRTMSETSPHIILHEQLHARSISYFDRETYIKYGIIEEATIQFLCQEISNKENIEIISSQYDDYVNSLRKLNKLLKIFDNDTDFAVYLINIDVDKRLDWIENKINDKIYLDGTIEESMELNELLESLRG
ncbi:hypothetical protein B5E58_11150 [Tyzzerella sp. An114]|uniref:phage minor capsid protein n=1 Tax=Tyzzerella sp. An114 TaxID=1965545 RepID=UPI000B435E25|nr:phage minor capsid protein [Tyzzerella sp. An114]OUQ56224.1 hypothetical protein B5E58_11150 [Tyzzerella sp. An114]